MDLRHWLRGFTAILGAGCVWIVTAPLVLQKRCRSIRSSSLFAAFFLLFLVLMITTEVLVMRSAMSPHTGPSRFRKHPSAVFGRMLTASRDGEKAAASSNQSQVEAQSSNAAAGAPMKRGHHWTRQEWIEAMWTCFGDGACPWQPVLGASDKFFVYSAYLEDDDRVRIVGVARTKRPDRVWCHWASTLSNGTVLWHQEAAVVRSIRENWNLRFSAVFILCSLRGVKDGAPTLVSVSTVDRTQFDVEAKLPRSTETAADFESQFGAWFDWPAGNVLPVRLGHRFVADWNGRPAVVPAPRHNLSVCVKPFHYDFNRAGQLIEFIEVNRILGVTHFTFYNHTVGAQVDCVLRRYIDEGLVQVLPWHRLGVVSQKEIRTEGIFASLNDCLYRNRYDSALVLFIDFDELVIPRQKWTLVDTIASLNTTTSKTAAYYFRNAFFYLQWPDDATSSRQKDEPSLTTLRKTRRNVKLHPHRIRSKFICQPRRVVEVGNHFVWEFRSGSTSHHVSESVAIMHHYRNCEFGGDSCLANPSTEDRTALKYRQPLVRAVRHRLDSWTHSCGL